MTRTASLRPPRHPRPPRYCEHRPSGLAYVRIDGRMIYLGPYGSIDSRARYTAEINLWRESLPARTARSVRAAELNGHGSRDRRPRGVASGSGAGGGGGPGGGGLMADLMIAYLEHCRTEHAPTTVASTRQLIRYLTTSAEVPGLELIPVEELALLDVRRWRDALSARGLARTHVNEQARRLRVMLAWAREEGLCTGSPLDEVRAVRALRRGRPGARESQPVTAVPDEVVAKTLPFLGRLVADMVMVQRYTGMRPIEIVQMTAQGLDTTGEVWVYRPVRHKTAHLDRRREIMIGPRAQKILAAYLPPDATPGPGPTTGPDPALPIFRPFEALRDDRDVRLTEGVKSPHTPSRKPAHKRRRGQAREESAGYTRAGYGAAVARGVRRAIACGAIAKDQRWSPRQLRKSAANEARAAGGLDVAQAMLGHAKADTTEIYAESRREVAAPTIRRIG
jgi:integrase